MTTELERHMRLTIDRLLTEKIELKAQLERAHKFIFEHYPDHFKAWSVKNV